MIDDSLAPTMKTVFIDLLGFKNLAGLNWTFTVTIILSLADY
jgi:hypothetical protein